MHVCMDNLQSTPSILKENNLFRIIYSINVDAYNIRILIPINIYTIYISISQETKPAYFKFDEDTIYTLLITEK